MFNLSQAKLRHEIDSEAGDTEISNAALFEPLDLLEATVDELEEGSGSDDIAT